MSAVFKREFRWYFTSFLGYIVFAIVFLFAGISFRIFNLSWGSSTLSDVFTILFYVSLLLVLPVLTMCLFSDDRRLHTDQALFTAPVSLTGIVLGKFLAALLVFALATSVTLIYAIVMAFYIAPDWLTILGNYFGLLLLGGVIISIGMMLSCLSEHPIVAALSTIAVSIALIAVYFVPKMISLNATIVNIVNFLSIYERYHNFTIGAISYADVVFFLSMQALFIFLTVRLLDRKRWN